MLIGDAIVNFDANIIVADGNQQVVEPKVMRLLEALAEKPGFVFSREELISAVWGVEFGGDERLSRAVSLLRKALGEKRGQRKYIETISRRGYRLIAEVSEESVEPTPPQPIILENTTDREESPDQAQDVISDRSELTHRKSRLMSFVAIGVAAISITIISLFLFITKDSNVVVENRTPINESLDIGYENILRFGRPGAIETAEKSFKDVLKIEPDNAAAHAGLSLTFIREFTSLESDPALLNQARSSALTAIEKNEHLSLSHIAMAWSAEFDSETDRALQFLERADLLDKDNELILESRIRILASTGNYDAAERLLLRAIDTHPDSGLFQSYAAGAFSFKKEFLKAEYHSKKAIELDPENPWFYSSAAQILHNQSKTPEAIKLIQDGLKIHESAALYGNLGTYLFFEGYFELAASAFEKTLSFDGNTHNAQFWANLGDSYRWVPGKEDLAIPHHKRAIELWENELQTFPDSRNIKTKLALCRAKLKIGEKPESLLKEIDNTEGIGSIYYYRSLVTAELWNDRKRALSLLRKTLASGYPLKEIKNDPELKNLRQDQEYHLIMTE